MARLGLLATVFAIGCGSVKSNADPDSVTPSDGPAVDTPPPDSSMARCDPEKPFAAAIQVPNVNSSNDEFSFSIVRDESVAFVGRVVQPPNLSATLLSATNTGAEFGTPTATLMAAINGVTGNESSPAPVADGLILYFHRQDTAQIAIFAATRADPSSAFSAGSQVTVDGTGLANALSPTISADGQTLYWLDFNDFGKVFAATRDSTPTNFIDKRAVSTMAISGPPILSADELTLFYSQGNGVDVLVSTRASKTEMFGTGVPVANVNSNADDTPVALSHDGCVLYISSTRSGGLGGHDIWEARRPL